MKKLFSLIAMLGLIAGSIPVIAQTSNIEQVNILKLATPSFRKDAPQQINSKASKVRLELLSATPNNINDGKEWLEQNQLSLPSYEVPNPFMNSLGNLPEQIPTRFGDNILVQAIKSNNLTLLIYGQNFSDGKYLFVYDESQHIFKYAYDFSNYVLAPYYLPEDREFVNQRINWAKLEKNILYVAHGHNTYAKSSQGMNAYLTAIDIATNRVRWSSQPLVCNSSNFVIIDDVIICGYGFTAEPDFLYLINKYTGEIQEQIPLKTAAASIFYQDNKLYVRAYDTDYVFTVKR